MSSTFRETISASEAEISTMSEYALYSAKSKFPNVIDGLKPVQRRIILTLHENSGVQKEATLAGRVMEKHPHGDASISDAISSLAQPFSNIIPLVHSDSNVGDYTGTPPAAARYVDVDEHEAADDLFFKGTDKSALRWIPCESEKGVEPANFVPVIPMTLIVPSIGIAVGYKTETSAISLPNACKLARKFIELKQKYPDTFRKKAMALAPYMVPDFPSYCHLRNSEQIVSEYRKGNYDCPFVIDGLFELSKDRIVVTTLPPGRVFGKVTQEAGEISARDKSSWLYEHFTEMADYSDEKHGSTRGHYTCILRRGENPFDLLAMFKKQFQMTSTWKPSRIFYDEDAGTMTFETPLTLLEKWADARYRVVLGGLKQKLIQLFEKYRKLMALIIIDGHSKEVFDIFNKAEDEEAVVPVLVKRFGLTSFQAKYLWSLPMQALTQKGKRNLHADLEEVKQKNKELQLKFTKIYDEIVEGIKTFENKHASKYPPKCTVPEFIGTACYCGNGWIQLESIEECDDVLKRFNSADIVFNMYAGDTRAIVGSDEPLLPNVDSPKYLKASYMGSMDGAAKYLSFLVGDGMMLTPLPTASGLIDGNPVPVGDKFSVITRDGHRQIVTANPKLVRVSKSASSPTLRNVQYVSPVSDDEVFVVHCNSKVPGVVNVDRIKGNAKISRVVVGKTIILGIYKIGQPMLLSIPEEVNARSAIKHMYVEDMSMHVPANCTVKLLLTKKRTSTDSSLVPRARHSAMYTIAK